MKRFGILLVMAMWSWPNLAVATDDQPSIDDFNGDWKGSDVLLAPEDLPPEALTARIQERGKGFQITYTDLGKAMEGEPGAHDIEAHFVPARRPGVFEFAPEAGSLLERMFASPASGNPLEGETLLWARIEGETLGVYSMKIDKNGGLFLDHYSWTRTETGLTLSFSQRTEDLGDETMVEAKLLAEGDGQ